MQIVYRCYSIKSSGYIKTFYEFGQVPQQILYDTFHHANDIGNRYYNIMFQYKIIIKLTSNTSISTRENKR